MRVVLRGEPYLVVQLHRYDAPLAELGDVSVIVQDCGNISLNCDKKWMSEAITNILKKGKADIAPDYLETIVSTAREYTAGIFRILRERGYDPKLMNLYVVGGGGCLIKNFGEYDKRRVFINPDICANATDYEYMALAFIGKEDGI